jgi:hypothetical protein
MAVAGRLKFGKKGIKIKAAIKNKPKANYG